VAVRIGTADTTTKETTVASKTIRKTATGRATSAIADGLTLAAASVGVEDLSMAANSGDALAATESFAGRALTCPVYTCLASSADIAAFATVIVIGVCVRAITVTESCAGQALTCPVYTCLASSADIAAFATVIVIGVCVQTCTVAGC